jgi:hypothetical protein
MEPQKQRHIESLACLFLVGHLYNAGNGRIFPVNVIWSPLLGHLDGASYASERDRL